MSKREGRSGSEVARRAIDAGLLVLTQPGRAVGAPGHEGLDALTAIRLDAVARVGEYGGDPVGEAREERERDNKRIWRGE